MQLTLITHDNSAGVEISSGLTSGRYSKFKLAVAFAKNSGVGRIFNDLTQFTNNGGSTEAIIGIDQSVTSYQALVNLKSFAGDKLFIHKDKNPYITFHPKLYLFGNRDIEKVIIGSSNLTAGGFYLNFEANVGITLDNSRAARDFKHQVNAYWDNLLSDVNTKSAGESLLKQLLESGKVIDETKQLGFRVIIERETVLPFNTRPSPRLPRLATGLITMVPALNDRFAMTLSGFDVSDESSDPVVLIPKGALKTFPMFWNWPLSYSLSNKGYPEHFPSAIIRYDRSVVYNYKLRIYYYEGKKEFRLQCEPIKRNGNPGDILLIKKHERNSMEFEIELVRQSTTKYNAIYPLLGQLAPGKAGNRKHYGFI